MFLNQMFANLNCWQGRVDGYILVETFPHSDTG